MAEGSDLEKKAKSRENEGFIDAVILHPQRCPQCLKEKQQQLQQEISLCTSMGCEKCGQDACQKCYVGELRKVEEKIQKSNELFFSPQLFKEPHQKKEKKPPKGLTNLGKLLKEAGF